MNCCFFTSTNNYFNNEGECFFSKWWNGVLRFEFFLLICEKKCKWIGETRFCLCSNLAQISLSLLCLITWDAFHSYFDNYNYRKNNYNLLFFRIYIFPLALEWGNAPEFSFKHIFHWNDYTICFNPLLFSRFNIEIIFVLAKRSGCVCSTCCYISCPGAH